MAGGVDCGPAHAAHTAASNVASQRISTSPDSRPTA
jgi:hypothetical protein